VAGRFVEDEETVAVPTVGAASLVGERVSAEEVMALSFCSDPPGADAIDFVSNSWVVGMFKGIGRVGGITGDEAGGGAVADGMTTSAGRGSVTVGCAGSCTARAGRGIGAGTAAGGFVITESSGGAGGFAAVPTCPRATAEARIITEAKLPTNCRAAIMA